MKATTTLATAVVDGSQLVLQEHDGQYFLTIDGVTLMSTIASYSEQEMANLGCGASAKSERVLIGGLGFGFTLKRVLDLVSETSLVTVAELLPHIIDWNRELLQGVNGKLVDDKRVTIVQRDVLDVIKSCDKERFDAILLDVDNSPDALVQHDNANLYSKKGLELVKAALNPKGRVVFWSANPDRAFEKMLGKVFGKCEAVPCKAYPKAKRFTHTLFLAER